MNKLLTLLFCLFNTLLIAQVNYTANDQLNPYNGVFRAGVNPGYYGSNWDDFYLTDIAAGNAAAGTLGSGIRAFRTTLPESIALQYEYKIWTPIYNYYRSLGLEDNTLVVGFAHPDHKDPVQYCSGIQTDMFANLYEPIWDGGLNGTPVNDENYFARYVYDLVNAVGDNVKFWEIWNEPGFDYSGVKGWLSPGQPGNWWENNPDPCDYKLRAPIFHFIRTMRIAYDVIKTMSPDDYIVLSGVGYESFLDAVLRNTDNPNNGIATADYPLGGGAYFDVIGFHNYPHFDGSVRYWDGNGFVYTRHSDAAVEAVSTRQGVRENLLAQYGYDGNTFPKKLWTITEINVPRKAFAEEFGSEELQRNYNIKTVVNAIDNGITQTHFWALGEQKYIEDATNEFDLMGLYQRLNDIEPFEQVINDGGIAYKTASDLLFGKTKDINRTNQMNLPASVKGGAYRDASGHYTYVLWARTTIDKSEAANAVYSFPSSLGLNELKKREWFYSYNQQETTIASQNINLTGTPIFLTSSATNLGILTLVCPATNEIEAMTTQDVGGKVITFDAPFASTTCPSGGATVQQVSTLGSGSFFPLGVSVVNYRVTDNCGNEELCSMTIKIASTGGGLGDCNPYRSDYNYRGIYKGHKYLISKSKKTYAEAVAQAASHGGQLVSINDAAENEFLKNNIPEVGFIGLSDELSEGNLQWPDGSPLSYTNFDNCSWCGVNTAANDYLEFHPWNGQWSFVDANYEQYHIMELACSEITACGCPSTYEPVCGSDGITYNNACEAECASEFNYTYGDCSPTSDCPNTIGGYTSLGEYNGHKYFLSNNNSNWLNAQAAAQSNGGYLASINDAGENTFLKNNISQIVFIGINDASSEGNYQWASGESVSYQNIAGGNSSNNDYGNMNFWAGSWSFESALVERPYIIEIPCDGGGGCTDNDNDGVCLAEDCDDNNANIPAPVGSTCNDGNSNTTNDVIQADGCTCAGTPVGGGCNVNYTTTSSSITITGLNTGHVILKLFNASWTSVFDCLDNCGEPLVVSGLANETHHLVVNLYDANWNHICEVQEDIILNGGGCTDNDNDGVCVPTDCDDNNPNLPTTIGSSCNDGNANTTNDVIQADGCTCAGTEIGGGCNINYTTTSNSITITGLTSGHIIMKLFGPSWNTIYDCLDNCPNPLTINGLSSGVHHLSVNLYDVNWQPTCELIEDVTIGNSFNLIAKEPIILDQGRTILVENLYPIPARDIVQLELSADEETSIQVQLYDFKGQRLEQRNINLLKGKNKITWDVDVLPSGLYQFVIDTPNGHQPIRFVKQRL